MRLFLYILLICILVGSGWSFLDFVMGREVPWWKDPDRTIAAIYTCVVFILGISFGYVYREREQQWEKRKKRKQTLVTGGT